MALRPINYKKLEKTQDKMNKKDAKKAGVKRSDRKAVKANIKTNAIRKAVGDAMEKKAPDWTLPVGKDPGLARTTRSAQEYGKNKEAARKTGLKAKTANKVYAKTYKAATKKINKASKGK